MPPRLRYCRKSSRRLPCVLGLGERLAAYTSTGLQASRSHANLKMLQGINELQKQESENAVNATRMAPFDVITVEQGLAATCVGTL